jgi:hypothetical protein
MTRGVKGSGPAKGERRGGARPITPHEALTSVAARREEGGALCPIDGAPLVGGQCAACAWRARKYAPVLARSSGRCECGAPAAKARGRFCAPCKTLRSRASARGIELPDVKAAPTSPAAPTHAAPATAITETPLRTCHECDKRTRQDPCQHCGAAWKRG